MNSNTFYRALLGLLTTVLLISCGSKGSNTPDHKQPFPEKGAIYLFKVPIEHQTKTVSSAEGICFLGNGMGELIVLQREPDDRVGSYMPCKVNYDSAQKVLTMTFTNYGAEEDEPKERMAQFKYDEVNDTLSPISSEPTDVRVVMKRSHLKRSDLILTDRREL